MPFPRTSVHHRRPMCFLVAVCPFVSCRSAVQAQPVPSMVALEYTKDDTPTFGKAQSPSCPFSPLSLQKAPSMQRPDSSWGCPIPPMAQEGHPHNPDPAGSKGQTQHGVTPPWLVALLLLPTMHQARAPQVWHEKRGPLLFTGLCLAFCASKALWLSPMLTALARDSLRPPCPGGAFLRCPSPWLQTDLIPLDPCF